MNNREVMQQALEVLEKLVVGTEYEEAVETEKVIDALRAALTAAVAKPVAWMDIDSDGQRLAVRQWSDGNRDEVPLYTTPPRRKPLTDQEVHDCFQQKHKDKTTERRMITRAIERAHGIGEKMTEPMLRIWD